MSIVSQEGLAVFFVRIKRS